MFYISVIIPTYKPGDYLWTCLDSIFSQTLSKDKYEVIIVLNGCKEPFENRILKYINEHRELSINFIQTDDGGVSNARNIGLDVARGEYIAFIDDDDFISPSYFEELYRLSNKTTLALSYELAFKDGEKNFYPYYITNSYDKFSPKGIIPFYKARRLFNGPVYKLIHRDVIGDRRFNCSFSKGEDSLFMFLISDRCKDVIFSSKKAVYYRRLRKGSATSNKGNKSKRFLNAYRLISQYLIIYLRHPFHYRFQFLMSRVLGTLKTFFI